VIVARHAQSEWNVHFGRTRTDPGIPDAPLTELGRAQARLLADRLARHGVKRLVSSPYRRTLQTAAIVAERLGCPIEVEPLVRERNAFSCDQGSRPDELARLWPALAFGHLTDGWWGRPVEPVESVLERAARFREHAAAWSDRREVAVISHWGFIRSLTGQEIANAGFVRVVF
jgi:broad specificity phosphatase PhoE